MNEKKCEQSSGQLLPGKFCSDAVSGSLLQEYGAGGPAHTMMLRGKILSLTILALAVMALFWCRPSLAFSSSQETHHGPIQNGLWVEFGTRDGERFSALVSAPHSVAYALKYVRGQAPVSLPESFTLVDGRSLPPGARITRVSECRNERCKPLRGIYGGRAPW